MRNTRYNALISGFSINLTFSSLSKDTIKNSGKRSHQLVLVQTSALLSALVLLCFSLGRPLGFEVASEFLVNGFASPTYSYSSSDVTSKIMQRGALSSYSVVCPSEGNRESALVFYSAFFSCNGPISRNLR